jgi:branched-chain amino acid aminotransferase
MMSTFLWTGTYFSDSTSASIAPDDRGFTLGDGLFETMLWTGARIRFFDDHMARLARSASALGLPMPASADQIHDAIGQMVTPLIGGLGTIRLTLSRGSGPRGLALPETATPTLILSCAAITPQTAPVSLVTVSIARNPSAPSSRHKTLSYIDNVMALVEAQAKGADDGLMRSPTGNLACTSAANIVVSYRGANLTPPISDGAMAGIIRGRLVGAGLVQEAAIHADMVSDCTEMALTNALIGVRGVHQIDQSPRQPNETWLKNLRQVL